MRYYYEAIDYKVLVVASINEEVGDWTAYVGAVSGKNHEEEWQKVAEDGTKVKREIGELLFPWLAEKYKRRY